MRKVLLSIVLVGFALVLFLTLKPQTANVLVIDPPDPAVDISAEPLSLEPAPQFSILQGESEVALYVRNNTSETVSFSLGHEHAHVSLRPQGDSIPPGITREIFLEVGPECPLGLIDLTVYLRADISGERVGSSAVVSFDVSSGELSLTYDQYGLNVLWNGDPAPRGAMIYFRNPGDTEWWIWGETPRTAPPTYLEAGKYTFEFKAELGESSSEIETFDVIVEEFVVKQKPEPEPKPVESAQKEEEAEELEPQEPKEPPKPGTKEYLAWLIKQQDEAAEAARKEKEAQEKEEEEPSVWHDVFN